MFAVNATITKLDDRRNNLQFSEAHLPMYELFNNTIDCCYNKSTKD
jgi:hypothetical protein